MSGPSVHGLAEVLLQAKDRYSAVVVAAAMRPRVPVPVEGTSPDCVGPTLPVTSDPAGDPAADLELMNRVAAKIPEAQRELVERVIAQVRARARKFTHNEADADDATQTAIMEVLRSATNFRGEGKLEAWCDRICVRTIIRQQRGRLRAQARLTDVDPDRLEHPRASYTQIPEASVWRFLDELSEDRQQALQLWAVGFTVEEIAAQTQASPNTVKDRLRMARRQLRQCLRQRETIASINSIKSIKSVMPAMPIRSITRKAT
ncbi:RNA polymerase sigma factor [Enhygromyxa salina]|uniref:ECF RNA polymerase sigma factor SigE n=1 Tax=Enhygromyxa salina TaxID=215803 RepID=A0A2S9YUR1_9BACT|nr:sigma-70 family RNA polymerase sigma factor [Enhygromyxa salina]PRQ08824.1 ECF RNA polymerase sigma factor SigE [Enhygromyxa salina]